MKTITIRGIDDELEKAIRRKSRQEDISINKLVLKTLKSALQAEPYQKKFREYNDLDHLAGSWTAEDEQEFNSAVEPLSRIDEDIWK